MEQQTQVSAAGTRAATSTEAMGTVVRWRYQTAVQVARMLNAVAPQPDPETTDT